VSTIGYLLSIIAAKSKNATATISSPNTLVGLSITADNSTFLESSEEIVSYYTKHDRHNYYNSSYFHALLFELCESPDYKYMLRQLMQCADKVYSSRAGLQAPEGGLLRSQAKDDPVTAQFDFKQLWTTIMQGDYLMASKYTY
jgi:hypothetical protein